MAEACIPSVSPDSSFPIAIPSVSNAEEVLKAWDPDISRAATIAAKRARLDETEADDFAQEARLKLLRALRGYGLPSDGYVRVLISNTIESVRAVRMRSLSREIHFPAPSAEQEDSDQPDRGEDRIPDRDHPHPQTERVIMIAVAQWVESLPDGLRSIYELLYVEGLTQREAARAMKVTQPWVAQLHTELLRRGRQRFGHLPW